ncbi:MAG: spore maturation protein [Bacillaceae bacterium]
MTIINSVSLWLIPLLISFVLVYGTYKRLPTYDLFVQGGKEGISMAISLIPFLVGMIVAISIFRASGALQWIQGLLQPFLEMVGVPTEVIPLALIRPISGSAGLAIMTDLIKTYGPDSLIGRIASTLQGSTDTTLYILTVYFGAVGIRKVGDALKVGLLADLIGIVCSIAFVVYFF